MITYLSRFDLSSELSSFINDGCKLNRRLKCFPIILMLMYSVCGVYVWPTQNPINKSTLAARKIWTYYELLLGFF